jgi:hypothetical protein
MGASCSTGAFDYQPGGGPAMTGVAAGKSYGDAVLDRALVGCQITTFARVGDFETAFFAPRCGRGGACHSNPMYPPNLKDARVYLRLVDKTVAYSMTMCDTGTEKYIDSTRGPDSSFIVSKCRDKPPRCPSGSPGALSMPFDGIDPASPDEISCLVAYVQAVIRK